MNRITSPRRTAAATALAAIAGLASAVTVGAGVADASSTAPSGRPAHTTTVTLAVPDCSGCAFRLHQGLWDEDAHQGIRAWSSAEKKVRHGEVSFTVASMRTHGMSVDVRAPWEGATGYVTNVVFRYGGEQPGDEVGFREARGKSMASACWAGTRADEVTIPLTVRKVRVEGVRPHKVPGSIAYTSVTQEWMKPMRKVWGGVMGSQDLNICGKR